MSNSKMSPLRSYTQLNDKFDGITARLEEIQSEQSRKNEYLAHAIKTLQGDIKDLQKNLSNGNAVKIVEDQLKKITARLDRTQSEHCRKNEYLDHNMEALQYNITKLQKVVENDSVVEKDRIINCIRNNGVLEAYIRESGIVEEIVTTYNNENAAKANYSDLQSTVDYLRDNFKSFFLSTAQQLKDQQVQIEKLSLQSEMHKSKNGVTQEVYHVINIKDTVIPKFMEPLYQVEGFKKIEVYGDIRNPLFNLEDVLYYLNITAKSTDYITRAFVRNEDIIDCNGELDTRVVIDMGGLLYIVCTIQNPKTSAIRHSLELYGYNALSS